jgi:hypothetical protein
MQENQLFEYAVIRVVPRVEREEFINVGVILYSRNKKFLKTLYTLNKERLLAFCDKIDVEEVEAHLRSFERICTGGAEGGPIGRLELAARFRWLTATRSTVVQSSKVHPGFCDDPQKALEKMHAQLVL